MIPVLLASCGTKQGEHAHHKQESPYKGEQNRAVKALSDEDIRNYLEGNGMGFGKAAELNGYPGPKHILENESQLGLSAEQKKAVQDSFDRMKQKAVELGKQIVENEKQLEALFQSSEITGEALQAQTRKIAELQGELRNAHLAAHLEMKRVLSPEQVEKYNRLRGYKN
jgi:Spy/CpxP family protein refolding chaperone